MAVSEIGRKYYDQISYYFAAQRLYSAAGRLSRSGVEVTGPRPVGSSDLLGLASSKARPIERRARRLAILGVRSYGFMTPSAVPPSSNRVTPKTNCFVTNLSPARSQVETVASLPARSRPETGPKPWPGEFGFKWRAVIMAVSEIGRKHHDQISYLLRPNSFIESLCF